MGDSITPSGITKCMYKDNEQTRIWVDFENCRAANRNDSFLNLFRLIYVTKHVYIPLLLVFNN